MPQKYSPRKGEASTKNSEGGAATRTIVTGGIVFLSFAHKRRLWWFEALATWEVPELVSTKNGRGPGFIPPAWSKRTGSGGRDPPSSAKPLRPTTRAKWSVVALGSTSRRHMQHEGAKPSDEWATASATQPTRLEWGKGTHTGRNWHVGSQVRKCSTADAWSFNWLVGPLCQCSWRARVRVEWAEFHGFGHTGPFSFFCFLFHSLDFQT
jgi:hypothetical protein